MPRLPIFNKPMTKSQKNERYKNKMEEWKKDNYLTFCFHLPKELVLEFRNKVKENGDIQRQIVIEMMKDYINDNFSFKLAMHNYIVAEDYKERCKRIDDIVSIMYQTIGEQPSKNEQEDNWLLGRLETIQNIANRGVNDD